jgi:hypothetical protein
MLLHFKTMVEVYITYVWVGCVLRTEKVSFVCDSVLSAVKFLVRSAHPTRLQFTGVTYA